MQKSTPQTTMKINNWQMQEGFAQDYVALHFQLYGELRGKKPKETKEQND